MSSQIGKYAFIVGIIISIVLGLSLNLGTAESWLWSFLIILGFVVGSLNVPRKEAKDFLWVCVGLSIVAYIASSQNDKWDQIQLIGPYVAGVFTRFMMFIVPAAVAAGLGIVWDMAKGE